MSLPSSVTPHSPHKHLANTLVNPADSGRLLNPETGGEILLSLVPAAGETVSALFTRLEQALDETDAALVHLIVFGSVSAYPDGMEALQQAFGHLDFPVTWVEGGSVNEHPIAAVQAFAFNGGAVDRIELHGQIVGSVFEYGGARHCVLGGLGPVGKIGTRGHQTKQTLARLEAALGQAGFSFSDVVRTWFFLEDILAWYDEFNQARTEIYSGIRFTSGSLPASTGVGARNPARAALAVAARAMRMSAPASSAREIASPLQCPAPAYGSSFSRAMELVTMAGSQLLISGTASIAPAGETLWRGDTRKQIELTMEVVEAILRSRGMTFSNVTRAIGYFKNRADAGLLTEWCAARGLQNLPVAPVECTICRDDLLFELEADACAANG